MTKTYIKPEIKTIKVELQLLDQTSINKSDENVNETGGLLGRGFDFFEEEEIETEE